MSSQRASDLTLVPGMPEAATTGDCVTTVVLIAIVGAIGWACLITALCWACTRPWASLLLASISLGAHVTTGAASPLLVLLWAVTSGGLAYWVSSFVYFTALVAMYVSVLLSLIACGGACGFACAAVGCKGERAGAVVEVLNLCVAVRLFCLHVDPFVMQVHLVYCMLADMPAIHCVG